MQQVAATTGLAPGDAEWRVDTVIADSKTAIDRSPHNTIILAFSLAAATGRRDRLGCSRRRRPAPRRRAASPMDGACQQVCAPQNRASTGGMIALYRRSAGTSRNGIIPSSTLTSENAISGL
jgi:hypothetical protein